MKKLTFLIILAIAMTLAGCDTTDTTTISVNLGGTRAVPGDISAVYIAVFELDAEYQLHHLSSVASPPTGSVSIVVPAETNLGFVVIAPNTSSNSTFYIGDGNYNGAEKPDSAVVQVLMSQITIMDGYTTLSAYDASSDRITLNDSGFYLGLTGEPIGDSDFYSFLEIHLEESSNGGSSYGLIEKIDFTLVADDGYHDTYNNTVTVGNYYRARVYCPVLGLYFYTWDEEQGYSGE